MKKTVSLLYVSVLLPPPPPPPIPKTFLRPCYEQNVMHIKTPSHLINGKVFTSYQPLPEWIRPGGQTRRRAPHVTVPSK